MPNERALRAAEEFNRIAERLRGHGRCDPTSSFETPELVQIASLWRDKAAGRTMPLRRDMDARALKPYLPNVCIVDAVESEGRRRFYIRLMGTAAARLLGDHTGKFLDEAVVAPFVERWTGAIQAGLDAGCPLRFAGRLDYGEQDYLAMEALIAPIGRQADGAEGTLIVMYTKFSARHLFDPLVKNAVSATSDARASHCPAPQ